MLPVAQGESLVSPSPWKEGNGHLTLLSGEIQVRNDQ